MLDEYKGSFFPAEFKFLKYRSKSFFIPKFDIKSLELKTISLTTVVFKLFVFDSLFIPVE